MSRPPPHLNPGMYGFLRYHLCFQQRCLLPPPRYFRLDRSESNTWCMDLMASPAPNKRSICFEKSHTRAYLIDSPAFQKPEERRTQKPTGNRNVNQLRRQATPAETPPSPYLYFRPPAPFAPTPPCVPPCCVHNAAGDGTARLPLVCVQNEPSIPALPLATSSFRPVDRLIRHWQHPSTSKTNSHVPKPVPEVPKPPAPAPNIARAPRDLPGQGRNRLSSVFVSLTPLLSSWLRLLLA